MTRLMRTVHPILLLLVCVDVAQGVIFDNATGEAWGYADVRQDAHMFWWLQRDPSTINSPSVTTRPYLMWLQGGPGDRLFFRRIYNFR